MGGREGRWEVGRGGREGWWEIGRGGREVGVGDKEGR